MGRAIDAFDGQVHPAWERVAAALNHMHDAIVYSLIGAGIVVGGVVVGLVALVVIGVTLLVIALAQWLLGFFGLLATPSQSTARAYIFWSASLCGASLVLSSVAGFSAATGGGLVAPGYVLPSSAMVPYAFGTAASLGASVMAVRYLMRVSREFGRDDLSKSFVTLAIVYVVAMILSIGISLWVLTTPADWRDPSVLATLTGGVILLSIVGISVWLMRLLGPLRDTIRGRVQVQTQTPFAAADDDDPFLYEPPAGSAPPTSRAPLMRQAPPLRATSRHPVRDCSV